MLEWVEDQGENIRLDADAGIDHLDHDPAVPTVALAFGAVELVASADHDRAAVRCELDGVLDQVPDDLLEPRGVGIDVPALGSILGRELEPLAVDLAPTDLKRLFDQAMAVGHFPVERHLAADDPHDVEQVVDQPRLKVDVLADHLQVRTQLLGLVGSIQERGDGQENRVERRPELVAQHREEPALGLVGELGLLLGDPQLIRGPFAVGDIERGADETMRLPLAKERPPPSRHPTRDAVGDADQAILDVVIARTGRVEGSAHRGHRPVAIVGVDRGQEAVVE